MVSTLKHFIASVNDISTHSFVLLAFLFATVMLFCLLPALLQFLLFFAFAK